MSFPRRHPAQHGSGAASSFGASSSSNPMLPWAYETLPPQRTGETGTTVEPHQRGYTTIVPSVPLPHVSPPGPPLEDYPLQFTIGTVTESSGAPHSYLQRGHSTSPFGQSQSPDGDGGRSIWSPTKPSSGVLLQWNCWSRPLLRWWTHPQLVWGHPTRQLLASSLQHSWSTWWRYLVDLIVARSPPIVWQCCQHRWHPGGTARIRNGRWHVRDCWDGQCVNSKSGPPTGILASQYSPVWQGIQCTDPWEARGSSGRSKCQPYRVVHGKRPGSPCKPSQTLAQHAQNRELDDISEISD